MLFVPSQTLAGAIEKVLTNSSGKGDLRSLSDPVSPQNGPELAVQLAPFTLTEQTQGFCVPKRRSIENGVESLHPQAAEQWSGGSHLQ